jgi:hypothetical protein
MHLHPFLTMEWFDYMSVLRASSQDIEQVTVDAFEEVSR